MNKIEKACALLAKYNITKVYPGELLAKHSSWKIGGSADIFVLISCAEDISTVLWIADQYELPVLILGGGSNLLFDDAGFRGIVAKIGNTFQQIVVSGNRIIAGAGVWVPCLARTAAIAGLTGLEHICGIPGSFGGLLFMNGGSQRKSIGDNVVSLRVMDRTGRSHTMSRLDCNFGYRKSIFQEKDFVVLEAVLECTPGDPVKIRREMLGILKSRNLKFPRKQPNCGSVFVSDPRMYKDFGPPGKIIEECNLKSVSIGDAQVSPYHANFIINRGRAQSSDVFALIDKVRRTVYDKTQYWLHCEVRYVRPDGLVAPVHHFLK